MTLIGAFNCVGGVVLFADRQETMADYAKWDTPKIYQWELSGEFRFLMAGAGDSDPIDMVWEELLKELSTATIQTLKPTIVRVINRVTRKTIFPLPRDERSLMQLIIAIQPISPASRMVLHSVDLFRTNRLFAHPIGGHYFTGSPILLAQFLNDQYFRGTMILMEEAEAIATYLLWEAKEYDTNCGKYSDVFILRNDGHIGRLMPAELEYWEEHWRQFKNSLRLLPLLSCTARTPDLSPYDVKQGLKRFSLVLNSLNAEQRKMRKKHLVKRNNLEEKLIRSLQRHSIRELKSLERREAKQVSQKAKPQQKLGLLKERN